MTLDQIFAKSASAAFPNGETLEQHTRNAVAVWEELRNRYKHVVHLNDEFWLRLLTAILFHDFGKATRNFQELTLGKHHQLKGVAEKQPTDNRIRHEFLSGLFLVLSENEYYQKNPESALAVFTHHKSFNHGLFEAEDEKVHVTFPQAMNDFVTFAKDQIKHYFGEDAAQIILPKTKAAIEFLSRKSMKDLKDKCFDPFRLSTLKTTVSESRLRYIFFKGLLNAADWTASSHQSLPQGLAFKQHDLEAKVKERAGKNFEGLRTFQIDCLTRNHVIAIAPTGSGKTEAALLWASQKAEKERIIYLLPTRVTANAIWERLRDYFVTDKKHDAYTAIIHSSAHLLRKSMEDNEEYGDYLRDRTYFKNINVCTIDQLLTTGFNLSYWELRLLHLQDAWIIIDEIHLYAPYTLGLICSTIQFLRERFNCHFFIMTATMPEKLRVLLGHYLDGPVLIRDTTLLDEARNQFFVKHVAVDALLNEIRQQVKAGKKVLLVVNTVDMAIKLYNDLSDLPRMCYHSRFIVKHRREKEKEIFSLEEKGQKSGYLLIATQVVEVSLDIDYDVLYTENAPVDAIIQRAGRINRKRRKKDTKVIIFKHQKITEEKIYEADILNKTFAAFEAKDGAWLTENDLTGLVEWVYKDLDIQNNKQFLEGLDKYRAIQQDLCWLQDIAGDDEKMEKAFTREGLDTVSVIPMKFQEELADKTADYKSYYEVSIRRNRLSQFKTIKDTNPKHYFIYIDVQYSYEKGLEFVKNKTVSLIDP